MQKLSRRCFIEAATAEKVRITRGEKVSSIEGDEEYMEVLVIEPIAALSAQ